MWLGCVFIICAFLIIVSLVFNDIYCTDLKVKKGLNEEKQRLEYDALKQKQELDAKIEMEKNKNESNIQYLEGQLRTYKELIDKFGLKKKE